MNLPNIAILGSQAILGLVGLGVGGAKVTHQEDPVEIFGRISTVVPNRNRPRRDQCRNNRDCGLL